MIETHAIYFSAPITCSYTNRVMRMETVVPVLFPVIRLHKRTYAGMPAILAHVLACLFVVIFEDGSGCPVDDIDSRRMCQRAILGRYRWRWWG